MALIMPTGADREATAEAISDSPKAVSLEREIVARVDAMDDRSTPPLRALRREYSRRLRESDGALVVELALRLKQHDSFEYRFIGQELVAHHPRAMSCLNEGLLRQIAEPLSSWWSVDSFAVDLAGPAWRMGAVADDVIEEWSRSDDRWWRRTALVCTVPLNLKSRGGTGDAERTLHICTLLVDDRDDMVVKAMSWALRALSVRDRAAVEAFLGQNEGRLAKRVLREVRAKLKTGLKNPRR